MEITSTTGIGISASTTAATATTSADASTQAASFAASLASAVTLAEKKSADFVSGRLGIQLQHGVPAQVIYFNEQGEKLTGSTFSAESILRNTKELGISLSDLTGLGTQLDAAGIGYKPYELYKGTGSDHGIDFKDLIAGGLGTAYDWTKDTNVAAKGTSAVEQLEQSRALATSLNLVANADVTQNKGIDPTRFTALSAGGSSRSQVMFNGSVAVWYGTNEQAVEATKTYGGSVIDLTKTTSSTATTAATTTNTAAASASTGATDWNAQLQSLIDTLSGSTKTSSTQSLLAMLNSQLKSA